MSGGELSSTKRISSRRREAACSEWEIQCPRVIACSSCGVRFYCRTCFILGCCGKKHPPPAGGTLFKKEGKVWNELTPALFRKEGGSAEPGVLIIQEGS